MNLLEKINNCSDAELTSIIDTALQGAIDNADKKERLGFIDVGLATAKIPYHKGFISPDSRIKYSNFSMNMYSMKTTDYIYDFAKYIKKNKISNRGTLVKYVENFIILVGNQHDIETVKIVPIETAYFNERTDEEINEYKKVKWYPLVEGENRYSAKSSLGGTFEIVKTEIDENYVTFYYETEGLQGNESKVILRKKIKEMNYIHPIRVEKSGINSKENKIVFLKDITMSAGMNTWKLQDMFDDISNVEFALMWGSRSKIIANAFTVNLPKQNNNIAVFKKVLFSILHNITLLMVLIYHFFMLYSI